MQELSEQPSFGKEDFCGSSGWENEGGFCGHLNRELVKTLQHIDGWRTVGKEGMVIKGSGKKKSELQILLIFPE